MLVCHVLPHAKLAMAWILSLELLTFIGLLGHDHQENGPNMCFWRELLVLLGPHSPFDLGFEREICTDPLGLYVLRLLIHVDWIEKLNRGKD